MGKRRRNHRDRHRFDAYAERDKLLEQLGFRSYGDYRKSDTWKSIRAQVLDRDNHKCTCCKVKEARHVHHTKYDMETLRGDRLQSLTSLCAGCHKTIEFAAWGKTGLNESGTRLKRRRKRKTRELCYESDHEYRALRAKLKTAIRTMSRGPERSAIMSAIRRQMREKERAVVVSAHTPPAVPTVQSRTRPAPATARATSGRLLNRASSVIDGSILGKAPSRCPSTTGDSLACD